MNPDSPSVGNGYPDLYNLIFIYKGQFGCVTDTETNLVYCHHRYYNPYSARWLTRDPSGLDGGINTYQYCFGNPLDNFDADGEQVKGWGNALHATFGWMKRIGPTENVFEPGTEQSDQMHNSYMGQFVDMKIAMDGCLKKDKRDSGIGNDRLGNAHLLPLFLYASPAFKRNPSTSGWIYLGYDESQ